MEDTPQNDETTDNVPHKKQITLPLDDEQIADLRAGEWISLSGVMYLMNWQASQRLMDDINAGVELPFDISEELIFFAVTTPAPWGKVIGSTGPEYTEHYLEPALHFLDVGARGIVGRGPIPEQLFTTLKKSRGLYFVTPSTASALLARRVIQSEFIAYPDLGLDAIRKIKVANFPAIVVVDAFGRNAFHKKTPPPPSTIEIIEDESYIDSESNEE